MKHVLLQKREEVAYDYCGHCGVKNEPEIGLFLVFGKRIELPVKRETFDAFQVGKEYDIFLNDGKR